MRRESKLESNTKEYAVGKKLYKCMIAVVFVLPVNSCYSMVKQYFFVLWSGTETFFFLIQAATIEQFVQLLNAILR